MALQNSSGSFSWAWRVESPAKQGLSVAWHRVHMINTSRRSEPHTGTRPFVFTDSIALKTSWEVPTYEFRNHNYDVMRIQVISVREILTHCHISFSLSHNVFSANATK